MGLNLRKSDFRRICIRRLKRLSGIQKYRANRLVTARLQALIERLGCRSLLMYLPMPHEPDVRKLMRRYRVRGQVYVPFMEQESFKLVKYRLPLIKKKYGILEPPDSCFYRARIDLAVVPVVGVDARLRRIGFGKGMYDRFFSRLDSKPLIVFVQLERCFTTETVTDDYDVQADFYITPQETIVRGKPHDKRITGRRCGRNR
jgi:5-formyltetrahydrofolate cyclo-ligase